MTVFHLTRTACLDCLPKALHRPCARCRRAHLRPVVICPSPVEKLFDGILRDLWVAGCDEDDDPDGGFRWAREVRAIWRAGGRREGWTGAGGKEGRRWGGTKEMR